MGCADWDRRPENESQKQEGVSVGPHECVTVCERVPEEDGAECVCVCVRERERGLGESENERDRPRRKLQRHWKQHKRVRNRDRGGLPRPSSG